MEKSESVRSMTDDQHSNIIVTMAGVIPSLSFEEAQSIINLKSQFVRDIGEVLKCYAGKFVFDPFFTKFTISDRTYELVSFYREGENRVTGDIMCERAEKLKANLGEEEGAFILEHQEEIPKEFQDKFNLVFTAWRNPSNPLNIAYLDCNGNLWYQCWSWFNSDWFKNDRLVRRLT